MTGELKRDVPARRLRSREVVQDRARLRFARLIVRAAHYRARAGFVQVRAKHECAGRRIARLRPAPAGDAPAGQCAREFRHVGLRVAGAHAERMQFHDFAREVLVEPALRRRIACLRTQRGRTVGADRTRLVEEHLHRGMLLDSDEHVLETAEHVRADRVAFEYARVRSHLPLVDRYREMVRPEMHETFDERRGRGQCAVHARGDGAAIRVVAVAADRLLGRALRGGVVALHRVACIGKARGERDCVRFAGPCGGSCVVAVELRDECRFRVGGRRFVGACAETEAVQRDRGRRGVVRVVHDGLSCGAYSRSTQAHREIRRGKGKYSF
ncbi:hypothetical protein P355_0132 [Burkholderia cenocepacia KC-01]|nr:hypothetical protein P355_0132 [Burkholderia cenocepacia KC-01]